MTHVVMLHGALGSSDQLKNLYEHLSKEPVSVSCLNFSGHSGQPFGHQFGIEAFADDVLRFLDERKIQKADIFGYSMGGYVAVWLAHRHPSRVDKILTLGTKFDWSVESAEKEVRKLNAEKILEKVPAFARILEQRHQPNDWKELLKRTGDMMLGLGSKPLVNEINLKKIAHPVKIMLGDLDDMADRAYSQYVASLLPNGSFEILPNTPHPIEKVDLAVLTAKLKAFFLS